MEERITENTIYGLFQETVNQYRNNVAVITESILRTPYMRDDDQHRSEFGDPPVVVNFYITKK